MKRHLLLILCLLCALHLWANPVTVDQARQKAAAFFQDQQTSGARRRAPAARQLRLAAQGRDATYYIYNAPNDGDGYVVVSGDDATEEILGYSNTGSIDPENMPCGMRVLLYGYEGQINYIREKGITHSQVKKIGLPQKAFMVNRLRARYDQHEPFYDLCPKSGTGLLRAHTLTGCVATAMAQLMYYHRVPAHITRAIPGYTSDTDELEVEGIPANTIIDWLNIKDNYYSDYNEEQSNAVANLMKIAGASVHMDYTRSFSGSYNSCVPWALKLYFGYDTSAEHRTLNQYPSEWEKMLRDELEKRGPVIYGGTDEEGGGHTFLLEGYDENGYFYVNYGWNTKNDESKNGNGWFLLRLLDGQDDNDLIDYHINQDAVFNVVPRNTLSDVDVPLRLSTASSKIGAKGNGFYRRNVETGNFDDISLSMELYNEVPFTVNYDVGVSFSKDGSDNEKDVATYLSSVNFIFKTLKPMPKKTVVLNSFSYGSKMDDGIYKVLGMSRESGKDTWLVNDNSKFQYAWAFVCNDKMAIRTVETDNTKLQVLNFEQTSQAQLRVGKEAMFSYTVANTGVSPERYIGSVVVLLNYKDKDGKYVDKVLSVEEANCVGNESITFSFPFTPLVAGEQTLTVLNKNFEDIFSTSVTAISADESLDMLEMTNLTIDNLTPDGSIDGTYLKGGLTMHNSDEVTKQESIKVILLDVETGIIRVKPIQVNIAPDETVTYGFQFTNLIVGHRYRVIVNYQSGAEFYRSDPMLCKDEDTGETYEGNENLAYYEYWFDKDYAKRKAVGIDGSKAVVRASIATDDLADGFHLLNFRVKNIDGEYPYSAVNTTPFLKLTKEQEGHLDYWIDDNRDGMKTLPLADTEDEQLLELDLSDDAFCSPGFHRLNIQVATKGSVMGSMQSQGVLKLAKGVAGELEYWFDNDVQHSQKLTGKRSYADDGYIYISELDLSRLTPGQHRLNFRAVSSTGLTAGSVLTCTVMKLSTGKATQLEYWFDDDTANRYFLDGTADGDCYVYDYMLDMSDLPFGLHRLNIRPTSTDGSNKGSLVTSNVLKVGTGSVKTLEYWFDGDIAHSRTLGVQSGEGADFVFADDLNLNGIAPGHHRLYCRAIGDDPTTTTAIVSYAVVVKLRYGADGDATMASYSLTLDNESVVAYGQLSAKSEVVFNYTLDASELAEGTHTLKATFWNSFGASVTDVTPFWVRGALDGDVNADGQVGIGDIVAITNYMAGMANGVTLEQADVNGDGEVGIGDIVAITNMMAGVTH